MTKTIVILEDNAARRDAMRACIGDRFYMFETRFFDDSAEMIAYLETDLVRALVISLDNDLDMKIVPDGRPVDAGEGRHVAEFLATCSPVCPVIIHTSNTNAAVAMREVLNAADWKSKRVIPMDDTAWIATDWYFAMRRIIVGPIRHHRLSVGQPS